MKVLRKFKDIVMVLLTLSSDLALSEKPKDDMGTVIGIDLGTTYSW